MKNALKYILINVLLFVQTGKSQILSRIKLTEKEIKEAKSDSVVLKKTFKLARIYYDTNVVKSFDLANEALLIAKKSGDVKTAIKIYNWIGDRQYYQANYDKCFQSYYKAFILSDSIKDKKSIAEAYYNLGWVSCFQQGNKKDVSYLYKSLQICIELNYTLGILKAYNALGSYFISDTNDQNRINYDSSVKYFKAGIELAKAKKWESHSAPFYVNLGELFFKSKDYSSSVFYVSKALELFSDSDRIEACKIRLGWNEFELNQKEKAIQRFYSAYRYSKRHNDKVVELEALESLQKYLYLIGKPKEAYEYLVLLNSEREEVNKGIQALTLTNLENNYKLERAQENVIKLEQKAEINELKDKRKTIYISILIGVGIVIIIIAYLLFRQNKLKQYTNEKLKEHNRIIREKKFEIEQSIEYARGIQTTFLPEKGLLDQYAQNFILYKPKDVVSGDFYWFKESKEKDMLLIACADCTGHGVPGALMSMVGINMLQQLYGGDKLHQPHTVLKNLNNEIKNSLKQNSAETKHKDGMDIALIRIDFKNNKLLYSGANRPMYLVRENEVREIKATKCAIGGYTETDKEFEQHELTLLKGDMVVLCTDGYADQFGGQNGKKFMTKNFKSVLQKLTNHKASSQLKILQNTFIEWKGDYEQVDDICVVGITI